MCERFVIPDRADVEREFRVAQPWWRFAPSYNVAGGQTKQVQAESATVTVGGAVWWLDFSEAEHLREVAKALNGKTVLVRGGGDGGPKPLSLTVTQLQETTGPERYIHAKIRGTLRGGTASK